MAATNPISIPTASALRLYGGPLADKEFALDVSETEVKFTFKDEVDAPQPIKFQSKIEASEILVYADSNFTDDATKYNVHTKLGDNTTAISDEEARALAAEGVIVTSVNVERTRALAAEGINTTAISDEETRALAAEGANTTAISDEETRALAAEAANTAAISSEVTRASAAESANADAISAEEARAIGIENANAATASVDRTAIRAEFIAADAVVTAAFEAADDAVTTAYTAADVVVTTAFEAADDVVTTAYQAADVVVTTAFGDADAAITTAYQAADDAATADRAAIRSEFKVKDDALDNRINLILDSSPESLDSLTELVSQFEANGLEYVQRLYRIEEFLEDRYPGTDFNSQEADPKLADGAPSFGYTAPS